MSVGRQSRAAHAFGFRRCDVQTVSSLDETNSAIERAEQRGKPLLLVTGSGACARLGPGYLLEMMHAAGVDGKKIRMVINCGSDAGYALLAIRLGWRELHISGNPDTCRRVREMIESIGGVFHDAIPQENDILESEPRNERRVHAYREEG